MRGGFTVAIVKMVGLNNGKLCLLTTSFFLTSSVCPPGLHICRISYFGIGSKSNKAYNRRFHSLFSNFLCRNPCKLGFNVFRVAAAAEVAVDLRALFKVTVVVNILGSSSRLQRAVKWFTLSFGLM